MRKQPNAPQPIALACGALEDNGRYFFLFRKNSLGEEAIELPHAFVLAGENPVFAIASAFHHQTGIDGQVHEITAERRYNAGSRKRRHMIPVLVFRMSAKSHVARPSSEFSGYRWLKYDEAVRKKLARVMDWMR